MNGHDALADRSGTIRSTVFQPPGNSHRCGVQRCLAHYALRQHGAIGVAHAIHATAVHPITRGDVRHSGLDVAHIVHILLGGLATATARIPAQLVGTQHAGHRCAVEVGHHKATLVCQGVHTQKPLRLCAGNALRIAQASMQHHHQRTAAKGRQRGRCMDHRITPGNGLSGHICGHCAPGKKVQSDQQGPQRGHSAVTVNIHGGAFVKNAILRLRNNPLPPNTASAVKRQPSLSSHSPKENHV